MEFNISKPAAPYRSPIGNLAYGTTLIIDEYPNIVYIKVNKHKLGAGIGLERWPSNHSILFNPKYGTLRAVSCGMSAIVLDIVAAETAITSDVSRYYK